MSTLIFYKNQDELKNKIPYINHGSVYFVEAPYEEPYVVYSQKNTFDITNMSETTKTCLMRYVLSNLNNIDIIYDTDDYNDYKAIQFDSDPSKAIDTLLAISHGNDVNFYMRYNGNEIKDIDEDNDGYFGGIYYYNDNEPMIVISDEVFRKPIKLKVPIYVKRDFGDILLIETDEDFNKFNINTSHLNLIRGNFDGAKYILFKNNGRSALYYIPWRNKHSDFIKLSARSELSQNMINTILAKNDGAIWIQGGNDSMLVGHSHDISYDDILKASDSFQSSHPILSEYISVKLQSKSNYSSDNLANYSSDNLAKITEIARLLPKICQPKNLEHHFYGNEYIEINVDALPIIRS